MTFMSCFSCSLVYSLSVSSALSYSFRSCMPLYLCGYFILIYPDTVYQAVSFISLTSSFPCLSYLFFYVSSPCSFPPYKSSKLSESSSYPVCLYFVSRPFLVIFLHCVIFSLSHADFCDIRAFPSGRSFDLPASALSLSGSLLYSLLLAPSCGNP